MTAVLAEERLARRLLSFLDFGRGRLSHQLAGAFIAIIITLAVVMTVVSSRITTESIEARAESQLASAEAVVQLSIKDLEDDIIFLNGLFASSETLTEQLVLPSGSRSLMISLISDLKHRGMKVRMYEHNPPVGEPAAAIIQKGFLGIRTLGLAIDSTAATPEAWLVCEAPIESKRGIDGVVSVSFRLSEDYLRTLSGRVGADITVLLTNDVAISTLHASALGPLIKQLKTYRGAGKEFDEPHIFSTTSSGEPTKVLTSQFTISLRKEGLLVLSMPMADLLVAKRNLIGRVLLSTSAVFFGASLLYLLLIRSITTRLGKLSAATRDIATGKLDQQVSIGTNDEIGELAASFNLITQRLRDSSKQIEQWNQTLEKRIEEQMRQQALERAQTLEELQRANRIDSEFVRVLAHELRNPLGLILGSLELLLEGVFGGLTTEQTQQLQLVERSAGEILDLFNAALDLSRADAGQKTLALREINVDDLLREIDEGTRHLQQRPNVAFVWQVAPNLSAMCTDPVKLKIILKNLVVNALKFTEHGSVRLDARLVDRGVEFSVTDTGLGIPAEALPVIFDAFRQVAGQQLDHGGVGLGLYIAHRLVELLGGTISVDSDLGRGSTFRVQVPSAVPPPAQVSAAATQA